MRRSVSPGVLVALLAGSLMVLSSCSRRSTPSSPTGEPRGPVGAPGDATPAAVQRAEDWDPALGTATITGTVVFVGKAPPRRPLDMSTNEQCGALHVEAALEESVIVNPGGTLRNVFVYVKKGVERWRFPVPAEPVTLDQKGCIFVPRVLGVQARQNVLIRNSDPLLHNVHSHAKRNRSFNFGQPSAGAEDIRSFRNPEVMIAVKCDLHGWMTSYIGVLPHPYHAVTGDDGAFTLSKLPPGEYTIEAWHEVYGTTAAVIAVGDRESETLRLGFEGP